MKREQLIKDMIQVCHDIYERNLVSSTGGNVSIRVDNEVIITASGVCLGGVTEEQLVKVDLDGNVIREGIPSKEIDMHLYLYKSYPDCRVVIHAHSPYIVAASCVTIGDKSSMMPIFTPSCAIKVGYLPIIPYYLPGSEKLSSAVADKMGESKAVVLQNHGVVCRSEEITKAKYILEEVEENAKIYLLTEGHGKHLTNEQVKELIEYYGN